MDLATLIVSLGSTVVITAGGVLVARYQYRRATKEEIAAVVAESIKTHAERAAQIAERVGALERSEPESVADVKESIDLLAKDVATVRERLQAHITEETTRRGKARDFAVEREKEQAIALAALTGAVQRLQERMKDLLDAAGGFRGIARNGHGE